MTSAPAGVAQKPARFASTVILASRLITAACRNRLDVPPQNVTPQDFPDRGSPKSQHNSRQRLISYLLSCCLATVACRIPQTMTLWGSAGGRRSPAKPRLGRSFALPAPGFPGSPSPATFPIVCPGLAIPFIRVILHTIGFLARRTRSSIG
jgi:hypothetical protein